MHPSRILSLHTVETVVVNCIDFRFREGAVRALKDAFGITAYDEIKLAGGAKNLSMPVKEGRREAVCDDVALAIGAHRATRVVLLNHENCGKYASEGHAFDDSKKEHAFHAEELRRAGAQVRARHPRAEVLLGFLSVDSDESIRIEVIA